MNKGTCQAPHTNITCPSNECNTVLATNCFACLSGGDACSWALCPGDGRYRCVNQAEQQTTCKLTYNNTNPCTADLCGSLTYCQDCESTKICAYCPANATCMNNQLVSPNECGNMVVGDYCGSYCKSFTSCESCQTLPGLGDEERPGCAWGDQHCMDVILHPWGSSVEFSACPSNSSSTTTTSPSVAPSVHCERTFDAPSFIGGLILGLGFLGGYILMVRFCKPRQRAQYSNLDTPEAAT